MRARRTRLREWTLVGFSLGITTLMQIQIAIGESGSRSIPPDAFSFLRTYACGSLWILSISFAAIAWSTSRGKIPALWTIAVSYTAILTFLILPPLRSMDAQRGIFIFGSATVANLLALAAVALALGVWSTVSDWEGDACR